MVISKTIPGLWHGELGEVVKISFTPTYGVFGGV